MLSLRTFGALVSSAALLAASSALADSVSNASIKGTFPFNETIIAGISAPGGSNLCDAAPDAYEQFSLTNQGLWTFDGSGHVHMDDTGVSVVVEKNPPTPPAAPVTIQSGYSEAHCDGTYQVQGDSTVEMDYICAVPAGPDHAVQFDVHAHGVITPHIIQVAVPPAGPGAMRQTPIYYAYTPNGNWTYKGSRGQIGCGVVGENTTIVIDRNFAK